MTATTFDETTGRTTRPWPKMNLHKLFLLIKWQQQVYTRYDFLQTVAKTGWATDTKVQVKLPDAWRKKWEAKPACADAAGILMVNDRLCPAMDIIDRYKFDRGGPACRVGEPYTSFGSDEYLNVDLTDETFTRTRRVQAQYVALVRLFYPDATFHVHHKETAPVLCCSGGELVGLIQPLAD